MSTGRLLAQSLIGGATGAASGATVGALMGAATAEKGHRKAKAKQLALKGARSGAVAGSVMPLARAARLTLTKGRLKLNEGFKDDLDKAYVAMPPGEERMKFTHDRIAPVVKTIRNLQKQHEMLLAPVPHLEIVRQGTIGGGLGTATTLTAAKIRDFVMSRLQSRSAAPPATSATSTSDEDKTASSNSLVVTSRVTLTKSANDPLAPDKGEPLQSETAQSRKARRIAELLKRSMPTGTAEGSASPSPKRGTP